MSRKNLHIEIYNFFVSLKLVPTILFTFIKAWFSTNQTVNKACKMFNEKLLKMGLSQDTARTFTKEYASIKDYIFEGFLKKKSQSPTLDNKKTGGFRDFLIKILPGGQLFLRIRRDHKKNLASAIFLEATKITILAVGLSRALDRDIYWVAVCIASYVLYSSLFGLASELIGKHQGSVNGLLGTVINIVGEALSDTKVVAIVGLALSSHSILGAPFVPLYHVVPNLDFVEHYISGFGIGLFAVKLYQVFTSHVSYSKALTTFGSMELSHQFSLFETSAELSFVCYSNILVGLVWEGLEEIAEKFTPRVVNIFFWNGVGDIFMNLLGALTAYALVSLSFLIKRHENYSNLENTKIDLQAVKEASDRTLTHMKRVIDSVYSENSANDISKNVGTYQLTRMNKAC
jgi:hypothetical protein